MKIFVRKSFEKTVQKIQISLKSDTNNGYMQNSSQSEKPSRQQLYRTSQYHCIFRNYIPIMVPFMGQDGKILWYRQSRAQMTIYGTCALHDG
jgi:hypothetical protein